jgi:hypothetical protein
VSGTKKIKLEKVDWRRNIAFEAYGVKIGVRFNEEDLIKGFKEALPNILPTGWKTIKTTQVEYQFSVYTRKTKRKTEHQVFRIDEVVIYPTLDSQTLLDQLESQIRITVAEFAKEHVFIHAGVVARDDKAIMIPGRSYAGKTTLTAEFCKRGFVYYSDEYAVLDKDGFVHPFPKTLSMRGIIDSYKQVEIPVEEFGSTKGEKRVPIGLILVTKYKKKARFNPKQLTSGQGIIESLDNSVSIRQSPALVLGVLTKVANKALILKTNRSESERFVDRLLDYLDTFDL